jgi:hypothetical protein
MGFSDECIRVKIILHYRKGYRKTFGHLFAGHAPDIDDFAGSSECLDRCVDSKVDKELRVSEMTMLGRKLVFSALILVGILAASVITCMCPCTQVETKRFAKYDTVNNSMLFVVSGFRACPITVEGPFPRWTQAVKVLFRADNVLNGAATKTYTFDTDFSTQYNLATAGVVRIEPTSKTAFIDLRYTDRTCGRKSKAIFLLRHG